MGLFDSLCERMSLLQHSAARDDDARVYFSQSSGAGDTIATCRKSGEKEIDPLLVADSRLHRGEPSRAPASEARLAPAVPCLGAILPERLPAPRGHRPVLRLSR